MKFTQTRDKKVIESYLRQDVGSNIYEMGDLDDFYWPYTTWYVDDSENRIQSLALIYTGGDLPVLLIQDTKEVEKSQKFIMSLIPRLPTVIYSHLSPGLDSIFAGQYRATSHGKHWKMVLSSTPNLSVETSDVIRMGISDLVDIQAFYEKAYPGNWFDERMLKTGLFFGLKKDGLLCSVSGIHVYSPFYRVAAIGNIATLPEYRGQGLGTLVTARLCQELLKTVDFIGLNVLQDNLPAVSVYRRLGFEIVNEYEEFMLEARSE